MNGASPLALPLGMKRCSRSPCAKPPRVKPLSEFYWDKSRGKPKPHCKACESVDQAARHAANPERKNTQSLAWAAANPERKAANDSSWNAAHPGRHAETNAAWYAENRERSAAYQVAWVSAHPGRKAAQKRDWCVANPEKVRIIDKKAKHNCRAALAGGPPLTEATLDAIFKAAVGKPCRYGCGTIITSENWEPDHKLPVTRRGRNGRFGGNERRNMQAICRPCNLSKKNKTHGEYVIWLRKRAPRPWWLCVKEAA
jgi:5-methylcytosine-specific restriction endonuclease McrA